MQIFLYDESSVQDSFDYRESHFLLHFYYKDLEDRAIKILNSSCFGSLPQTVPKNPGERVVLCPWTILQQNTGVYLKNNPGAQ